MSADTKPPCNWITPPDEHGHIYCRRCGQRDEARHYKTFGLIHQGCALPAVLPQLKVPAPSYSARCDGAGRVVMRLPELVSDDAHDPPVDVGSEHGLDVPTARRLAAELARAADTAEGWPK